MSVRFFTEVVQNVFNKYFFSGICTAYGKDTFLEIE